MRRRYIYWLAATVRCPYCMAKNALPESLKDLEVFECFHCQADLTVLFFYTQIETAEGLDKCDYGEDGNHFQQANVDTRG